MRFLHESPYRTVPVHRAQSKLITDEGTREHRLAVTALVVVTWGALITIYCSSRNSSDAHRSRAVVQVLLAIALVVSVVGVEVVVVLL